MRNTPAVTIVAAWIRADTGVGPSIASGSQRYSGNWALLPTAPTNSSTAIAVAVVLAMVPCSEASLRTAKLTEPTAWKARNMATMKPQSPMRLVTNAFLPAVAAESRVCQNAIRKYEHVPTPSQPRNVTSRFSPSTRTTIESDEQVHVQEELGELRIAVHVADREQVDQRSDARDEEAHRDAQRIGEERHVDVERRHRDPREQDFGVGALGLVESTSRSK